MRIPGVEREDSVLGDDLCHLNSNATLRKIHQRLRTNRCPILLAMVADNFRGGRLQRSLISSVITLSLSASVVCIILTGFCHLPPLYASSSFLFPHLCTQTPRISPNQTRTRTAVETRPQRIGGGLCNVTLCKLKRQFQLGTLFKPCLKTNK